MSGVYLQRDLLEVWIESHASSHLIVPLDFKLIKEPVIIVRNKVTIPCECHLLPGAEYSCCTNNLVSREVHVLGGSPERRLIRTGWLVGLRLLVRSSIRIRLPVLIDIGIRLPVRISIGIRLLIRIDRLIGIRLLVVVESVARWHLASSYSGIKRAQGL